MPLVDQVHVDVIRSRPSISLLIQLLLNLKLLLIAVLMSIWQQRNLLGSCAGDSVVVIDEDWIFSAVLMVFEVRLLGASTIMMVVDRNPTHYIMKAFLIYLACGSCFSDSTCRRNVA